jgi:hypothetical protein
MGKAQWQSSLDCIAFAVVQALKEGARMLAFLPE